MSKTFKIVDGDISDGYHTFDELYEHRCLLFINLALSYKADAFWRKALDGWPLIGLDLPVGQVTYHVPEKYLPLFKDKIQQGGPAWDGHTSATAAQRLARWASETPLKDGSV